MKQRLDGATLSKRYEVLRAQVMSGQRIHGNGLGLALLMRQGLAAWMEAWSSTSTGSVVDGTSRQEHVDVASAGRDADLVIVLASMALKSRLEVRG